MNNAPEALAAFDLTGKLAVVTGASRGIGLAMATALARAGADIIGISASLPDQGSDVQRAVEAAGRSFTALRADFADRDAVIRARRLAEHLAATHRHPRQQCGHDRARPRRRPPR